MYQSETFGTDLCHLSGLDLQEIEVKKYLLLLRHSRQTITAIEIKRVFLK